MKYNPSEPRPYRRRNKSYPGRWEVDIRGDLDNGLHIERERRVFPANPSVGKIGKRQAAAMALEEFQRWNRHGQVLRPGESPPLPRTGAMSTGNVPTVAQFAPDYLELCASPTLGPKGANAPSTLSSKEIAFRVRLLPVFGSTCLDQVHRRDTDRYVIAQANKGRSLRSIALDLKYLRHLLSLAKRHELIASIPDFLVPAEPPGDVAALAPDQAKRFLDSSERIHRDRDAALLELYLRTGLRAGEGLGLYASDFDLESEQPTVQVLRSYSRSRFGLPKGRKTRVVPLAPKLAAKIDELLCARGISPRSTQHPFGPWCDSSRPLSQRRAADLVSAAAAAAETGHVHLHMLRHTFGTDCARRGVPVLTIKEWMGHAHISVTMRYLHLAAPDHLRWANLLAD